MRLVDADEIKTMFDPETWQGEMMIAVADSLPTVEAVPVVHGEWQEKSMDYVCSHCKTVFDDDFAWIQGEHKLPNFCPECGADMRKKVQDETD